MLWRLNFYVPQNAARQLGLFALKDDYIDIDIDEILQPLNHDGIFIKGIISLTNENSSKFEDFLRTVWDDCHSDLLFAQSNPESFGDCIGYWRDALRELNQLYDDIIQQKAEYTKNEPN